MIFFIESTEDKAEAKAQLLRKSGYRVEVVYVPNQRRKHMEAVEGNGTWQVRTLPKNHYSFKVKKKEVEEPSEDALKEIEGQ